MMIIDGDGIDDDNINNRKKRKKLFNLFSRFWPGLNPIASRPSYSNLGFSLVGHMIAAVRKTTFTALLKDTLLRLNMTHTGFKEKKKKKKSHLHFCLGVIEEGKAPSFLVPGFEEQFQIPNYDFGFDNPAGGVYSSVDNLSKLMFLLFNDVYASSAKQILVIEKKIIIILSLRL
jgi:CubicO group peptidase (beta-lactamase class C family)